MLPTPLQEPLDSARLANARGEHDALVRLATEALARAEAAEHTAAAAEAGLLLARGLFGQARYADSVRHGQAARQRWQQAGDDEQACAALRVVVHGLMEAGRLQLAQQQFDAAGHTLAALQEALQSEPHDEAQEDFWELQAALQRQRGEPAEADALEARVADARGVRQRRAAELHAELNLAADARVLPARLHALETRALPPRG